MNVQAIEQYLSLVGQELQSMGIGEPIELLLIGGGYMLTQVGNRNATGDIDTVWVAPDIYSGSEIYRLFRLAVQFVAEDENLAPNWLNIDMGDFVRLAGPLPKRRLWKQFGMVQVYLPPKDFILAHKLIASRNKDGGDIEALCQELGVHTRKKAQRILDTYISRELQEIEHVSEKLAALFAR
jgi:hypothetical protein